MEEIEPTKFKDRERRFRFVSLTPEQILTLMGRWRGNDFVRLPVFHGMPDGTEVQAVHFNWEQDRFVFRLYHESFPIIYEGMAPRIEEAKLDSFCISDPRPVFVVHTTAADVQNIIGLFVDIAAAEARRTEWMAANKGLYAYVSQQTVNGGGK